jgi:hypothetical protein
MGGDGAALSTSTGVRSGAASAPGKHALGPAALGAVVDQRRHHRGRVHHAHQRSVSR